jgi:hypothetical protein
MVTPPKMKSIAFTKTSMIGHLAAIHSFGPITGSP